MKSNRPRGGAIKGKLDPATFKSRFALQRVAAGLLAGERRETKNGKACDRWPVCGCHRNALGTMINIYRQVDGQGARYAGTITCGSVWTCPVCAARIAETRRLELQLGIRRWSAMRDGNKVYLMTLTAPHTRELPLADFLDMWKKALTRFKSCATYQRIWTKYARAGSVRSLEVTYGANGWHPHTHDLVFARPGLLDDYYALDQLRQEWTRICLKVGLGDSDKRNDMLAHGFDIQGGDYAAEYVAKFGRQPTLDGWGVSDELTRSHSKTGTRAGHLTPFALLLAYHKGDDGAGILFREYARNFEGQRMLYWSPLLKRFFRMVDATDEELARAPLPAEEGVCQLDGDQWRLVLSREARGELLFWAAQYGKEGVDRFLEELSGRPKTHRSTFDSGTWRPWH